MIAPQSLILEIDRYLKGDDAAGDPICATLEPSIRSMVCRILSPQDADCDDIVQDSMVTMLTYLRRSGIAPDNPQAFAVTIARNRCLNLQLWRRRRSAVDVDQVADKLPQGAASPLDLVDEKQRHGMLLEAMNNLDRSCRKLLEAVYAEEAKIEDIRRSLGLNSVQAVYHRRNICLKKARKFLSNRLFACQPVRTGRQRLSAVFRQSKELRDG